MDDFEYSVHISDQDWNCFFQECEDCDLLSPVLASREDSGMSDIDEMSCHYLDGTPAVDTASTEPDPDLQIDGPPDCEGSPVYNYLSKYGIRSPEQVLSGSEEDLHLQTVNLFFEQLKSVTENEQPLEQSHVVNWGSEETGHLEGLIDKQDILSVDTGPSGRIIGEIAKQGVVNTWGDIASEKAVKPESTNAQEDSSKSNTELLTGGKLLSAPLITERMKQKQQGRCDDLRKDLELKPETKSPDKEKIVTNNWRDMTEPILARQNIAQLDTRNSSDSKDSAISQIPVSPSNLRRKRRKKKRMSVEPVEPGYEAQIHIHQSELEEERFVQREEMNNVPANVWKTENISLQRIKTTQNTDLLQPRNMCTCELEASADLKSSKSLPISITSNLDTIPSKPEVVPTSFNTVSKSRHDMSVVNNGQLKAEIPSLPQIDKVLNLQESGLDMLQFDPAVHLESWTGIRETLSTPLSDNSDAGCQRKSLLSPNISIAANSTEPPSSIVSFKLTEDKDLSCLVNETDYSVMKNEQTMTRKWNTIEISDLKENRLSLTENMDGVESGLDGNGPETFICSQDAPQKQMNISEYQSNLTSQTIEINTNIPINETDAKTERRMSDNIYHRTDESHIQNRNKTSEALIVNPTAIKPGNSDESDNKRDISANEVAVSAGGEQLFCGKSTRSTEHIHGPTQDFSELPHKTLVEMKYTSSAEAKSGAKDLESVSLDAADHLPCPVYAISSFWNEMEKLTINDILRIRQIGNTQHTSVLTQPEDSIADTIDAGDSGYFTQPDDSKPDRLSGDMSYISDLDEDIAQLQTTFSSKQEDESYEFPSSCGVMWENDPDSVVVGDEMVFISSETTLPEHLYTANAQHCLRRMCKNISVQNLQALDAKPIRQILRNASMHSIYSEVDDFIDPFYHVNTSGSKSLSDDEEEVETSGITFSEIIQFFFGEDEPERCASRADSTAASHLDGTGTSLPEAYDHFFSEFDAGSFVCPIVEESDGDKIVPIFSCSRSANRYLQFPEAYDYFFQDSPGNSDEDDENENTVINVGTQYDHESPNHDPVDMYEHFYSEDQSDFLWMNPFSLRSVQCTGFTIPEDKTCSGEIVRVKTFPNGIIQPIYALGPDGSPFPDSLLLNLENRIFQQLAEQQKKCMEMQTVVADPRLDAPFLPLKQADMCLVCIAFASWVLKSTGSGADTWKAALLANVSALSAIRYLRRHKREEVSGKTSLRQIEPP